METDINCEGPDRVIPAEDYVAWSTDKPVKMRMAVDDPDIPVSIVTAFREMTLENPDKTALVDYYDTHRKTYTYQEYYDSVIHVAKVFIKLGLESYRAVGIMGRQSPLWLISHLAAIHAGGVSVALYNLNTVAACDAILNDSVCNIIVVDSEQELEKFFYDIDRWSFLKAIIQCRGKPKTEGVYSWEDVMNMNVENGFLHSEMSARIAKISPNKCCSIFYTSGTTGAPKGVLLSHDNALWSAKIFMSLISNGNFINEANFSHHRTGHITGTLANCYLPMMRPHGTTYFCHYDITQTDEFFNLMKEIRPTYFVGVPGLWQKIMDRVIKLETKLDDVRQLTGLDNCRNAGSVASPSREEVLSYFSRCNVQIMEYYGMTETAGCHVTNSSTNYKLGTVGCPTTGMDVKLINVNENGVGEILLNGRNIFMGYLNREEATMDNFDENHWFRSGDLGRFDGNGFLTLTGRVHETIKLSFGALVYPPRVENDILDALPCLSNCVIVGDSKDYPTALLTFKTEADCRQDKLTDSLHKMALDWCRKNGITAETVTDIIKCAKNPVFVDAIQKQIDRVNEKSLDEEFFIKKWTVLLNDFSVETGEIGPTNKLRRGFIHEKYKKEIDVMYRYN